MRILVFLLSIFSCGTYNKEVKEKKNKKTINKPKTETKDISRLEINDSKFKIKQ
jgi:hypothetical protein